MGIKNMGDFNSPVVVGGLFLAANAIGIGTEVTKQFHELKMLSKAGTEITFTQAKEVFSSFGRKVQLAFNSISRNNNDKGNSR